jgi:hypothetical protein
MFGKVLDTFQPSKQRKLDDQIVALELLAPNFNESLSLSPLFRQIEDRIRKEPSVATRQVLTDKLFRVATVVKDKHIEVLEVAGDTAENTIWFDELAKSDPINVIDRRDEPLTFKISMPTGKGG